MPHIIKESHLEELCSNCKKPHGKNVEVFYQRDLIYEKITCENCGYIMIKKVSESQFEDRFSFM